MAGFPSTVALWSVVMGFDCGYGYGDIFWGLSGAESGDAGPNCGLAGRLNTERRGVFDANCGFWRDSDDVDGHAADEQAAERVDDSGDCDWGF